MMFWKDSSDTPLHRAVIEGNVDQVVANLRFAEQKNGLGLTPLELARYLDRGRCCEILGDTRERTLFVVRRHETQRREYSLAEFEKAFGFHYLSHLKFRSYGRLKKVARNCPLLMRHTGWGEQNRAWAEEYAPQILSGTVVPVTIQWIDAVMGYGAFTNWDLEPGTFVGEYTGVVRPMSRLKPDHNAYCFHYPTCFFSWNYTMVDAEKEGNELRFVNHSDRPNLEPICALDGDFLRLCFTTKEFVPRGAELTFNYGTDYWRRRKKRQHQRSSVPAYQKGVTPEPAIRCGESHS